MNKKRLKELAAHIASLPHHVDRENPPAAAAFSMTAFAVGDLKWSTPLTPEQKVQPLCIGGWAIWMAIHKWDVPGELVYPKEDYLASSAMWFSAPARRALQLSGDESDWLFFPLGVDLAAITPKRAAKNIRALCRDPSIIERGTWLP